MSNFKPLLLAAAVRQPLKDIVLSYSSVTIGLNGKQCAFLSNLV